METTLTWEALTKHLDGRSPLGVPDLLVAFLGRVWRGLQGVGQHFGRPALAGDLRPAHSAWPTHLEPLPGQAAAPEST